MLEVLTASSFIQKDEEKIVMSQEIRAIRKKLKVINPLTVINQLPSIALYMYIQKIEPRQEIVACKVKNPVFKI